MTVFELREELAKIPNQKADVIVTIKNVRNIDSVTTSLKQVVTFNDMTILRGDLNG